ncbi:MAG: type II toxin-antitoxin system RelB/DinJ family antitoxin [Deltaproteobacteria bacterium]|jgi:DNA-damage-inducible protein J|nr:type II toxin-antitoxin system RelB/DinJ family antitoxin [Deltaproteobacteria bacterium]
MAQQVKNELFSVRVDPRMKADASAILASYGLNLSDAVRMLLARITIEKQLPQGLVMDRDEYDVWFRGKVHEALVSTGPKHSHETVMANAEAAIRRVVAERE